jgi:hypothetical protein
LDAAKHVAARRERFESIFNITGITCILVGHLSIGDKKRRFGTMALVSKSANGKLKWRSLTGEFVSSNDVVRWNAATLEGILAQVSTQHELFPLVR